MSPGRPCASARTFCPQSRGWSAAERAADRGERAATAERRATASSQRNTSAKMGARAYPYPLVLSPPILPSQTTLSHYPLILLSHPSLLPSNNPRSPSPLTSPTSHSHFPFSPFPATLISHPTRSSSLSSLLSPSRFVALFAQYPRSLFSHPPPIPLPHISRPQKSSEAQNRLTLASLPSSAHHLHPHLFPLLIHPPTPRSRHRQLCDNLSRRCSPLSPRLPPLFPPPSPSPPRALARSMRRPSRLRRCPHKAAPAAVMRGGLASRRGRGGGEGRA